MGKVMISALVLFQLFFTALCFDKIHTNGWLKSPRRGLADRVLAAGTVSDNEIAFRAELIHRDHIQSPFSNSSSAQKPANQRLLEAVKRSNNRRSRMESMRQSAVAASKAVSLESPVASGSGEYVMEMSLGSPVQKFTTIVDTGSDLIWVQCLPCTDCYTQTGAMFSPTKSTTYKKAGCSDAMCTDLPTKTCSTSNTCTYSYSYGDGSNTQGDLAYEATTLSVLGGTTVDTATIAFGCGHDNTGSFAGVGGLTGLGKGPLSLPSQMSPAISQIFSYCLVTWSDSNTTTSPITFGSAAANSTGVVYTPMLTNPVYPTFYYVGVTGISVAGVKLSIAASAFAIIASGDGGVILDSGTTITYWQTTAWTAVKTAVTKHTTYSTTDASSYGLELCFDTSGTDPSLVTVPTFTIHFTNVDLDVPPANAFAFVDEAETVLCLAMGSTTDFTIIGNWQQQNHLIVTDVVSKRVGFKSVQCDTL